MRLLHFDTLERLVLTDFHGKTIPPYAILSHRWSDSEILIEDVLNGTYKEREEGYRKLAFCAKQAAQDKLQYFWIDTCCMDTWNNSERSKAINSCFSGTRTRHDATSSCQTCQCRMRQSRSNAASGRRRSVRAHGSLADRRSKS
jgi:hypothetical protein